MRKIKSLYSFLVLLMGVTSAVQAADMEVPLDANTYKTPFNTLLNIEVPQATVSQGVVLTAGAVMRLKVLLPPGVGSASIFGTSNDFIGMGGDPVMGTFLDSIPAPCNTSFPANQGAAGYMCGGVGLNTSSTLSLGFYAASKNNGNPIQSARYAYFLLYSPSGNARSFSFTTLRVTFQFLKPEHETMYKTWRAARPWFGQGGTGSWDGVGEDYSYILPPPACNKSKGTAITPEIGLHIPYIDMSGIGLPSSGLEMQLRMVGMVNPGDTVVIIDSQGNRNTLGNPGLFLWGLDSSFGTNAPGFNIPGLKGCTP